MNQLKIYILILVFSLVIISCKNTEAELYDFNVPEKSNSTLIDQESLRIEVSFPDSIKSAENFCTTFKLSDGAEAYVDNVEQTSGISENNYEKPFEFTVISEDEMISKTWFVRSFNNEYSEAWGLGGFISEEVSQKRSYEWYIDQAQTGIDSDWNCAPSCVIMASRWQINGFSQSVEDARQKYHPEGGGWFTNDIDDCLTDYKVVHSITELSEYRDKTTELLVDKIKYGNIILLAIDVHYLSQTYESELHVGKYYKTIQLGTGHCIVLKGYKIVDGKVFFEVYDPIGYDYTYSDGSFMGKNRYYCSDDIYTAAFASWNYAFVIWGPHGKKNSFRNVNINEIPNVKIL